MLNHCLFLTGAAGDFFYLSWYTCCMENYIYAGTYTSRASRGIYRFSFADGKLSDPELFTEIRNPKYISVNHGIITSLGDFDHGSGVAVIDETGNITEKLAYEERTSCFIVRNQNRIYTANYHTGCVSMLEDTGTGLKLIRTVQIQDGAGCHQVLLWKDLILVPCLFLDRVVIFDSELNQKGSIRFNHGTGPRHGVFTKDGEYLYLVSELSNELFVIHTGDWQITDQISVLPNGKKHLRDTAAIRLSEDEKHLYVSTRTQDILSVVELQDHHPELIQTVSCGGKHPRDFILADQYLICANRNSDEIVSFHLHDDGTIGKITSRITVPEAVSLAF